jgi:hypothetical protein
MITSKQITATTVTNPELVYTSSGTSAITTIILCNTGTVDITDESVDTCNVNVYLVKNGDTPVASNLIVNNLIVPAGETVFFSDEKIILDSGDMVYVGTSATSLITATVSTLAV